MKKIDRYIAKAYIIRFVMAHLIVFGLYVSFDIMQRVDMFYGAEAEQALSRMLIFYLYQVPANLMNTVPPLLMLSAGLVFVHMSRNGELLTLKSCGISMRRVALPVFAVTVLVAILLGAAQETVIPNLYRQRHLMESQIEGRVSGPFWLTDSEKDYKLYVEDYDFSSGKMTNITLLFLYPDVHVPRKILEADRGRWAESGQLLFERVSIQEFDSMGGRLGEQKDLEGLKWPTSLSVSDFVDIQHGGSLTSRAPSFTLREMPARIEENIHNPRYRVLFHTRIADKFIPIILLLIGIPLLSGTGKTQKNRLIGALIAILVTGIYYVLMFIMLSVGNTGAINPVLAAWLVPAAGFLTGLVMFARMRT